MRVSLAWIGVILIVSVLFYFSWSGFKLYESFVNEETEKKKDPTQAVKEGFQSESIPSGISITTCPAGSKSYLDSKGKTLCCKGDVTSDTCRGETICSLSEGTTNFPTCSKWWEAYLLERGRGRCPRTMPYYFETKDLKKRGCTSGKLIPSGEGPAEPEKGTCYIYNNKREDEGYVNSCSNTKMLDETVCFPNSPDVRTEKNLIPMLGGFLPAMVQCKFGDIHLQTAGSCQTNNSMLRMMQSLFDLAEQYFGIRISMDDWKKGSKTWDPIDKLNFCSVAERYKIKKNITFKELPDISVF